MATELLSLPDRPTAIVAASDVQAVGCLEAATQLGIKRSRRAVGGRVRRHRPRWSDGPVDGSPAAVLLGRTGRRSRRSRRSRCAIASRSTERLELELVVRSTTAAVKRKGTTMSNPDTADSTRAICGGKTPSSTSCTCDRSPTATATAAAISKASVEHLDHLRDLGVDAIWLTPCFPSPQRDHGYDVADYFDIEPTYGTLDDFDRLVAAASELDRSASCSTSCPTTAARITPGSRRR